MNQMNGESAGAPIVVTPASGKGWLSFRYYRDPNPPKIVQWVVRNSRGYITNDKQAGYFVVGFLAFIVGITLIFVFNATKSNVAVNPSPELIHRAQPKASLRPQRMRPRLERRLLPAIPSPQVLQ